MGEPHAAPCRINTNQPYMNSTTDTKTDLHERLSGVVQDENKFAEARKRAFVYLHDAREKKPVVFLERMVEHLDRDFLETLDLKDDTQLTLACAVAALVAVKDKLTGPETASGIIALAEVELLS